LYWYWWAQPSEQESYRVHREDRRNLFSTPSPSTLREMTIIMIMPTTMRNSPASSFNLRTLSRDEEDQTEDLLLHLQLVEMDFLSVMLPLPAQEEMERDALTRSR